MIKIVSIGLILIGFILAYSDAKMSYYQYGLKKGKLEGCRSLIGHLADSIKPVDLHKALRYCNVTLAKELE